MKIEADLVRGGDQCLPSPSPPPGICLFVLPSARKNRTKFECVLAIRKQELKKTQGVCLIEREGCDQKKRGVFKQKRRGVSFYREEMFNENGSNYKVCVCV